MKICTFVFVILAYAAAYAQGESTTCQTNCVKPGECDLTGSGTCGDGFICCQIVTPDFRTTCRQYGGECKAEPCPENLHVVPRFSECQTDEICCILV